LSVRLLSRGFVAFLDSPCVSRLTVVDRTGDRRSLWRSRRPAVVEALDDRLRDRGYARGTTLHMSPSVPFRVDRCCDALSKETFADEDLF
jgi:hypothetical protein